MTMAIFGYGRVSTSQQDTENQRLELEQAGWQIDFGLLMLLAGRFRQCNVKHFLKCSSKIRDGETLVVNLIVWGVMRLMSCKRWALADRNIKVIVHQLGTLISPPLREASIVNAGSGCGDGA
jgi:hypothetical protein